MRTKPNVQLREKMLRDGEDGNMPNLVSTESSLETSHHVHLKQKEESIWELYLKTPEKSWKTYIN